MKINHDIHTHTLLSACCHDPAATVEAYVRRAAELLLSSSKSALEIAADVGVENYTYFTKLFKRKMGFTPSQYRKIQHKNPV